MPTIQATINMSRTKSFFKEGLNFLVIKNPIDPQVGYFAVLDLFSILLTILEKSYTHVYYVSNQNVATSSNSIEFL